MNSVKIITGDNSIMKIDGDRRGTKISCVRGTVSVSQQNDSEDHILSDDEGFVIDRKGLVIAWALSEATVEIAFPGTDRCGLKGRLRRLVSFWGQ